MATDLSNWEESSSNSNVYNRETSVSIDHEKRRTSKRQNIRVQTNISTGDYKVFAIGTKELGLQGNPIGQDIQIYSYTAENNKYVIANDVYMNALFLDIIKGGDRSRIFDKFNSGIKLDTYNIAKSKADTAIENRELDILGNYKGYKSAKNQSRQAAQTITRGPRTDRTGRGKTQNNNNNATTGLRSSSRQNLSSTPNTDILNPSDSGVFSLRPIQLSGADSVSNFEYMRYPEGRIPNLGYDYIQITAYDYVPVGVPKGYATNGGQVISAGNPIPRGSAESRLYKDPGDVIQFPMIGSISETNAVNWTDGDINEINNIAAGIAYNTIKNADNPFEAVGEAFKDLVESGQAAVSNDKIKAAIAAYFAGQAANVPNILQRTEGKMINNNLELLFNGPSLRSFNFSFQLRPRTKSEADLCRRIIRSLKKNSAPNRSPDFMFLTTPKIFRIQYIYNTDSPDLAESGEVLSNSIEHPFMNKIKPCALIGLNVNYTPEGSYMTYEDGGSMTGYDLNLTFKELEPIYADDHLSTPSQSMGY